VVLEDPDVADVARVLAGDTDAFAGIVSRWQGRLLNLAWRFCRDRATAEDMAQEAFVRAFRSLRTFRGESAFSTWLTAIALNTYRSALRDRPAPAPPVPMMDVHLPGGGSADALTTMMGEERATTVRRMVLTLPAKYREALVVFYFEERDIAETARILKLAEGTLKARLHRGRELLKRRLDALASVKA
jgi:RNA polymerase sigma-70 factor (ECF subfamily)